MELGSTIHAGIHGAQQQNTEQAECVKRFLKSCMISLIMITMITIKYIFSLHKLQYKV